MKGHLRQRSAGSWEITYELPRSAEGKRRQKTVTFRGTKREAQIELNRLLVEVHTGGHVEPGRLTVADYLSRWLADYAQHNVSGTALQAYKSHIHRHLIPALGAQRLAGLLPLHIQAYYNQALLSGRIDGTGGLAAQTVLHHHRILREALQQAVKWQLVARNVADAVEPPRPVRREMIAFDAAETNTLLEKARGSMLSMPVLLGATTGMRRGEILALRWQDVDLKAGTLAVRQSLEQTKAGLAFKAPKTPKSRRVVVLPNMAVESLTRHKGEQARHRLLVGEAYQDQGLVCARDDGSPMLPESVTRAFARLAQRLGLKSTRFHDLRHSHASLLLKQGVHPKVVSERLGHATVAITLDRYSHLLPGLQEDAARQVEAALRGAL